MAENEPLINLNDPENSPEHEYEHYPEDDVETHLPAKKHHPVVQYFLTINDIVRDHLRAWGNVYMCGWLIVGLEIPLFLSAAPGIQLIEDAICRRTYGNDFTHEMCQGPEVQSKIAELRGVLAVLAAIPSLLFAVPYGMLADRKGRKLVVGLTLFAAFCCYVWSFCILYFYNTLPFGLIYTYPLILWVGGGGYVAGSIITAIAAEVAPNEEARTRAFFFLGVIGRLVSMAAPPIGARIMHFYGAYTAYFLSIPLSALPVIPLLLLPETANFKKFEDASDDGGPIHAKDGIDIHTKIKELKDHVRKDMLPILKSVSIMIGMASMVMSAFLLAIGDIIMQYMKARFGWDYEKSTHIIALSAGLQIIFLCTVLPISHKFLTNRYEARKADLLMSKFSIFFDFLSPLMFGLSNEPAGAWVAVAVGCFGIGFGGSIRAYMTSLVPKQDVALLYTLFGTASAVGALFAAPLLQVALAFGIRRGGMMVGLPFFIIAAVYGLNTILVWALKLRPERLVDGEDEEDETLHGGVRI